MQRSAATHDDTQRNATHPNARGDEWTPKYTLVREMYDSSFPILSFHSNAPLNQIFSQLNVSPPPQNTQPSPQNTQTSPQKTPNTPISINSTPNNSPPPQKTPEKRKTYLPLFENHLSLIYPILRGKEIDLEPFWAPHEDNQHTGDYHTAQMGLHPLQFNSEVDCATCEEPGVVYNAWYGARNFRRCGIPQCDDCVKNALWLNRAYIVVHVQQRDDWEFKRIVALCFIFYSERRENTLFDTVAAVIPGKLTQYARATRVVEDQRSLLDNLLRDIHVHESVATDLLSRYQACSCCGALTKLVAMADWRLECSSRAVFMCHSCLGELHLLCG